MMPGYVYIIIMYDEWYGIWINNYVWWMGMLYRIINYVCWMGMVYIIINYE